METRRRVTDRKEKKRRTVGAGPGELRQPRRSQCINILRRSSRPPGLSSRRRIVTQLFC